MVRRQLLYWSLLTVIAAVGAYLVYDMTSGTRPPTLAEYLEHIGPGAKVIEAGKLTIGGQQVACGNAPTVIHSRLNDLAGAHPGFIIINEPALEKVPPVLRLYAYFHECGHISGAGTDEEKADCHAIKAGRAAGWLDPAGIATICEFWKPYAGDSTHAPGSERCEKMTACFAAAG